MVKEKGIIFQKSSVRKNNSLKINKALSLMVTIVEAKLLNIDPNPDKEEDYIDPFFKIFFKGSEFVSLVHFRGHQYPYWN